MSEIYDPRMACLREDPELFFSDSQLRILEAKRVCQSCPVRPQCLEGALERQESHGVFGGLSAAERNQMLGLGPGGRPRRRKQRQAKSKVAA